MLLAHLPLTVRMAGQYRRVRVYYQEEMLTYRWDVVDAELPVWISLLCLVELAIILIFILSSFLMIVASVGLSLVCYAGLVSGSTARLWGAQGVWVYLALMVSVGIFLFFTGILRDCTSHKEPEWKHTWLDEYHREIPGSVKVIIRSFQTRHPQAVFAIEELVDSRGGVHAVLCMENLHSTEPWNWPVDVLAWEC